MAEQTDYAQLAEDLSPEDLRTVLAVFATDVRRLTANLAAAAAEGDVPGFRRVAHGLAGAAGAVGARALDQNCRLLMLREDIPADQLGGFAAATRVLSDAALAELEIFMARLDTSQGRG